MEGTQREILIVLLERLKARGLVSETACSKAVDWVCSAAEIPPFLRSSVCLTEEDDPA